MGGISNSFSSMNISVSALQAQRQRMDVVAANLANVDSTSTTSGPGPFQRRQVIFQSVLQDAQDSDPTTGDSGKGVVVSSVVTDASRQPKLVSMPGHPNADKNGNVLMPDIRPAEEMADMISASRSYEANSAALRISRSMFQRALELGRI